MKKRWPVGLIVGAGALFASVTPASAILPSYEALQAESEVLLTSCGPTATIGTSCIVFLIDMQYETATGAGTAANFDVQAGRTLLAPGWTFSGGSLQSQGSSNAGSFTVKKSNGTMSFTVNLICGSPPCELFGTFTFTIKMKKGSQSAYRYQEETRDVYAGACTAKQIASATTLYSPSGTARVKYGGSTRTMKVWSGPSLLTGFIAEKAKNTVNIAGPCNPSPIVLGSLELPTNDLGRDVFGWGA